MGRFRSIAVVCLAVLALAPAVATAQAPPGHWPSARASGWNMGLFGLPDSQKVAAYDWAADHYDFITGVDGQYLDYIRDRNPDIGGLAIYEIFVCVTDETPKQDALTQRSVDLGKDPEDCYMHYCYDVVSPVRAGYDVSTKYPWLSVEYDSAQGNYMVNVPGWDPANDQNGDGYVSDTEFASRPVPGASARRKQEARVVIWSWSAPRWLLNLGEFETVKVLVDLISEDLSMPTEIWEQSQGYGMIFFDETSGWLWPKDKLEYPRAPGGDGTAEWQSDIAQLLDYAQQQYGAEVLIGGGGLYWTIGSEVDVVVSELFFSTWNTWSAWEGGLPGGQYGPFNALSGYARLREAGKIQLLQHQYNLLYYIADLPDVWARDKIFGVAAYYLLQNPGKDYWAAYRGVGYWPTLETCQKYWSHALEVDIGQPTGTVPPGSDPITPWGVWVFAEGADPGHPDYPDIDKSRYKVYARDYTKGRVLLKPKSGYDSSRSTLADNTATTHDLGEWCQIVQDDGSLSLPVNSVTLRNGEAVVLTAARPTVTLQVSTSAVAPGSPVTYAIDAVNPLPDAVSNVKIEGKVPPGCEYVVGTAKLDGVDVTPELDDDPDDPEGKVIRVYVPQIAAGGTVRFVYEVSTAGLE